MKGQTLYERMVNFGIEPTEEQVLGWIDTWQKDIAIDAGEIERVTFTNPVADVEVALPPDFISVVEFRYLGKTYNKSNKVVIDSEGYVTFPESITGDIVMRYRKVPEDYTSLQTDLVIHPLLQPIAFYYLISLYYDKEGEGDEESNMAARWMSFYEVKKKDILDKIYNLTGNEPVPTKDVMRKRRYRGRLEEEDDG